MQAQAKAITANCNVLTNPRACVVLSVAVIATSAMLLWQQIYDAAGFAVVAVVVTVQALGG